MRSINLSLSASVIAITLAGCVSIDVTDAPATAAAIAPVETTVPAETNESDRVEVGNLVMEGIPEIPNEVKTRLRQYQNVRGHGFQDWTENGILISTRFGEVSQNSPSCSPAGRTQADYVLQRAD